jgi:23S rRNA (cytosine1962-C5)-methyltransferase
MWISDAWQDYELLDCSLGERLERWGKQILVRPDPQAIWDTPRSDPRWHRPDGRYSRSGYGRRQLGKDRLPESWSIRYRELQFRIKPMNFKHTGLFPEQP